MILFLSNKKSEIDFYTQNINVEERFISDIFKKYEYVKCTSVATSGLIKFEDTAKLLVNGTPTIVVLLNNTDAYPVDSFLEDYGTTRGYYIGSAAAGQVILYKDSNRTLPVTFSNTSNLVFYLFVPKDATDSSIGYAQLYTAHTNRPQARNNLNKYFASLFSAYGVSIDIGNPWTGLYRTHSIVLDNNKLPNGSYLACLLDNYGYTSSSLNGAQYELDALYEKNTGVRKH